MKSRRDAAASPSQGQAIHPTSADPDDESPVTVAPSRHSRLLSRPSEPLAPLSPLAPPQPLPVRARVGTQPPGARLVERAAAVVARVKTGRHPAVSMTTPLSASLSAPPAVSPATAAATAQVVAPSAARSPAEAPASPPPPPSSPPPSLPPPSLPLPVAPRTLQPLVAAHPYPPPAGSSSMLPPASPSPASPSSQPSSSPLSPSPSPSPSSQASPLSPSSSLPSLSPSSPLPVAPVAPFSVAVPAFASSATTLAVSLAVVDNPAGERFAVRASLHWSGPGGQGGPGGQLAVDERAVEIGRIIPEPPSPDEPVGEPSGLIGTFLLPLAAPARALLRRRDGQTRLRLTIRPAGEAPLSPALHVKILPPRWH